MARPKFEESLSKLEAMVKSLEKGDLPLEDSLRVFEEGVRLSKDCLKLLDEAQKKVEILMQTPEGGLIPVEYCGETAGGIPLKEKRAADE